MRKEDSNRIQATEIVCQICNRIKTNNDNSNKSFVSGWRN